MDITLITASLLFLIIGHIIGYVIAYFKGKASFNKEISNLQQELAKCLTFIKSLEKSLEKEEAKNLYYSNNISNLTSQKATLEERNSNYEKLQKGMSEKFELVSRKLLEESSAKISSDSALLLKPLREQLQIFQNKIDLVNAETTKERESLKNHIEVVSKTTLNLNNTAENLSSALKGENKIQGNWGEFQLEMLLENSSLKKGQDYFLQGTGLNLVKNGEKSRQQPDAIIKLPDSKHVIIDAKTVLTSYEKYYTETNSVVKESHLKDFTKAIRKHIDDLSGKNYHEHDNLYTPDFTIMFLPIDSAYMLAISDDANLFNYACNQKIIITSPTTLFLALKTYAYIIQNDKQSKNGEEIVKHASELYNHIVDFLIEFEKIGASLEDSLKAYENAKDRFDKTKGNNITYRTNKLKKLGINPKKEHFFLEQIQLEDEILEIEESNKGKVN